MPNPSIERGGQGLSPLAAPHVKRSTARCEAAVVVGHPNADSLSHAFAAASIQVLAECGYTSAMQDLYADGFDPVQRTGEAGNVRSTDPLVERYCAEIASAELILVFHPNWWGQPPAMVKGWIDRVLRLGVAYAYAQPQAFEDIPVGLLKAREALVVNTSNTPADREAAVFGDPLDAVWRRCVFPLCGVSAVTRKVYGPVSGSSAPLRAAWLREVRELVKRAALPAKS